MERGVVLRKLRLVAVAGLFCMAAQSAQGSIAVPSQPHVGRYLVILKTPAVAARAVEFRAAGLPLGGPAQRELREQIAEGQRAVVTAVREAGGQVLFRYTRLVNALSIAATGSAVEALAARPDVAAVEPVSIVRQALTSSVPFIGAPEVWERDGATGEGIRIAVVDTGVDYTHADFGGPGTLSAYNSNDPEIIEDGSFPTDKVVDGYDFVGGDYDVLDSNNNNDLPVPDPDPLDDADHGYHGTHVAGICCGQGVDGKVGMGVAPDASILAYKVWHNGSSTSDVLIAAYERAADPDEDGDMSDAVDVISFSGGVDYGTADSLESVAAQQAVDLGIVFVAAAGNSGNDVSGGGTPYVTGAPSTAPGVISVAATTDTLPSQTIKVLEPEGTDLPSKVVVHQVWSERISKNYEHRLFDARRVDRPDASDGMPSAGDHQLCNKLDGRPLDGKFVLIFKGSRDKGDCVATEKVFRAQRAGAAAVLLWSGFAGDPFNATGGKYSAKIHIPAWMVSRKTGAALGDLLSPNAPDRYSTRRVTVKILRKMTAIPEFGDRIADFSSQGPARTTNALKPDISAPGVNIVSAAAGSGTSGFALSGTSMATPHISGVAALLLQLHPEWSPEQVKAALMNQAMPEVKKQNGNPPIPASIQGAGRVRADQSAAAVSLAIPGSLSFGLQAHAGPSETEDQTVAVSNLDSVPHTYTVTTDLHYNEFEGEVAGAEVSLDGVTYSDEVSFPVVPLTSFDLYVRLVVDPSLITESEQEYGMYGVFPDIDGAVSIAQDGDPGDTLRVPWHLVPLAASDHSAPDALSIPEGGSAELGIAAPESAGVDHTDLYLLDATDPVASGGEEDITYTGVRSFVGSSIGDGISGVPTGTDAYGGIDWLNFLTNDDEPTEPVEWVIRAATEHNTTRAYLARVYIDVGNDGIYESDPQSADAVLFKTRGGITCLQELSSSEFCAATYYPDYSNFNTSLTGLVADASDLGLTDSRNEIGYYYELCTDLYSGDVSQPVCESVGRNEDGSPMYSLDVITPPLGMSSWLCGGFFGGPSCGEPITVTDATTGARPDILAVFPNNPPPQNVEVIDVD